MMRVHLHTNFTGFEGDIAESIRAFLGETEISAEDGDISVVLLLNEEQNQVTATLSDGDNVYTNTQEYTSSGIRLVDKRYLKRAAKRAVYEVFKEFTGMHLAWGALTGIRPTRLVYEGVSRGMNVQEAAVSLKAHFDVSDEKAGLLADIVQTQMTMPPIGKGEFDLYIGIPFCPSRCHYCSFASYDADRSRHLMAPYIDALKREIACVKEATVDRRIRSIYIGGGTPTALSDELFAELLQAVNCDGSIEFTVEAGRPDTITEEKLSIMQEHRVNRISINPQTTKQATLDLIGRKHTVEQLVCAFELAAKTNISHINTDLIVGLPGETGEDFLRSVEDILHLGPDNITLHTLARKRGSVLKDQDYGLEVTQDDLAEAMREAQRLLYAQNYGPYYLYRQKYMSGSLENVGFAKRDCECLYNVDNMEETADIIACGAGAVSKRIFAKENRIERIANVKNITHYVQRIDEMLERKETLFQLSPE